MVDFDSDQLLPKSPSFFEFTYTHTKFIISVSHPFKIAKKKRIINCFYVYLWLRFIFFSLANSKKVSCYIFKCYKKIESVLQEKKNSKKSIRNLKNLYILNEKKTKTTHAHTYDQIEMRETKNQLIFKKIDDGGYLLVIDRFFVLKFPFTNWIV